MAVSGTTSTTSTAAAAPSAVITSTAPTTSTASTAASAVTTNSIDVASIVASLMSVENQPLTALQNQVTTSQTIISDLGTIKSKVATLQSALSTFENPSTYNNPAVSSTDSTVVTATATSAASIGSINIAVTQIAKPAQIILTKYSGANFTSANDTVSFDPAKGFKLTVGGKTYSTMDAATPIQSTGAGGQSTLTDLQNWINGLGANVTARALQTTSASNWVLQISGTASGLANNVSVDTGTTGTGSSISNLSFALTPSQTFPATPGTAGTLTVPLAGGSGSGATANVSYDATGAVTSVQLQNAGTGYKSGDALTIAAVTNAASNQNTNSTQFSALAAGKTVVLDGLTFTAGANGATAAQVASAFANLPATATSFSAINTANQLTGDSTGGVFTGGATIAGLSSGLVNANNTVVFDGAGYINATGSGSVAGNAATTGVATAALSGIVAGGEPFYSALLSTASQDAIATINGITVNRSSNAITDVVQGVTLNLVGPSATSTTNAIVTVNQGPDNSSALINTLIAAYNDVITSYNTMTANANSSSTPGTFANDPTMLSFVNNIKSMFAYGATDASSAKITGFTSGSDPMSFHSSQGVIDGYLQIGNTKYNYSNIPTGSTSSISNLSFALTPSQIFPATPGTAGTLTVPLTGGSGSGATANVSYDATGAVTSVQLQNAGTGYKSGDALTIALASTNQDTNSTQFSALTANQTMILDGLTFKAGTNGATAAQVASAFANLPATATSFSAINTANKLTGDSTGGVFTGGTTIAGLSSGLVNANNTVVFDGAGYINATGSGSVAGNAATTGVATAALSGIGATTKINTPTVNQFVSWVNGLGAGVNATFDGSSIGISGTQNGQDITVDFSGLNNNISRTTTSLSAMGMDLQLDGTIQFNTASYQTAVSNGLFNKLSIGLKMGFSGVTSNLDNFLTSEIDPTNGALVAEITNQQNSILDIQKRETDLQTRLNGIQQGYINQYSALNALLFQLNSTSTSLASSLAAVTNINAGK